MTTTILPFVARKRSPVRTGNPAYQATIIIFPGVRYEAFPESEHAGSSKQASRPRKARRKTR